MTAMRSTAPAPTALAPEASRRPAGGSASPDGHGRVAGSFAGGPGAPELTAVAQLSRTSVERLSEALRDPAWLRERRLEAWDIFERLPVPDTRSEAWRYTDLSRVPWQQTQVALDGEAVTAAEPAAGIHAASDMPNTEGLIRLNDGFAESGVLSREAQRQGVVFTDLATAIREHADLLERHLLRSGVTPDLGKFAALHCALMQGGVFLYVPDGVEVVLPLRSLRRMRRDGAAVFPHTLIVAGEASRLTYIEESASDSAPTLAMNCGAVEVLAGPGAQVRTITIQNWGRHAFHYNLQRARIQRDATLHSLVVTLGGRLSRVEVQSVLEAEGGTSEMLGLYLGDEDQHIDHHTLQLHQAPHTTSDLLFKGALRDRSRSAFSGLIKVFKGAQRTDAYQKNRNLLLSPEARADSLPNLEIEADDVRCSHGATIGAVDELQLFYLRSRGLSRETAERLLVFGFFEEVLGRLPLAALHEPIRAAVERKSGFAASGSVQRVDGKARLRQERAIPA
jgi:Fe-S cluster assembly protein SufD